MKPWKIHILHEYGTDLRPHSSAFIRLLRPLSHPTIAPHLKVTSGLFYNNQVVDLVIVDRLWRPDISVELATSLIDQVHATGARLVYTIDDNLLDLPQVRQDFPLEHHLQSFNHFLKHSDTVWVTTPFLQDRLSGYNPRILIIPNALDERLLVNNRSYTKSSPFDASRLVIGCMGTFTHDNDIRMILPALYQICERYSDQVALEFVGAIEKSETFGLMSGLPYRMIYLLPGESEYPLFQLWFTGYAGWDIALAPLLDNLFNQCKSDIKFLDYCSIGAAGIYSRVGAYPERVQHKSTGWLTDNTTDAWIEALETLITNRTLRHHISVNATQYLYRERVLAHCAPDWLNAIEATLAN